MTINGCNYKIGRLVHNTISNMYFLQHYVENAFSPGGTERYCSFWRHLGSGWLRSRDETDAEVTSGRTLPSARCPSTTRSHRWWWSSALPEWPPQLPTQSKYSSHLRCATSWPVPLPVRAAWSFPQVLGRLNQQRLWPTTEPRPRDGYARPDGPVEVRRNHLDRFQLPASVGPCGKNSKRERSQPRVETTPV